MLTQYLLDEHGGGIGADDAEDVVEQTLQDLLGGLGVASSLHDFLLDGLELVCWRWR